MASEWGSAVQVSPLVTDIVDPTPKVVLNALISGASIPKSLLISNMTYGFSGQTKKFFDYGENTYFNGLPKAQYSTGTQSYWRNTFQHDLFSDPLVDTTLVKAAIESDIGEPVTLLASTFGEIEHVKLAMEYLVDAAGYDPGTNIISNPLAVFSINGSLSSDAIRLRSARTIAGRIEFRADYTIEIEHYDEGGDWTELFSSTATAYFTIPGIIPTMDAYQVLYYANSDASQIRIWNYVLDMNSNPLHPEYGAHPELLPIPDVGYDSPFFPMIHIIDEYKNVDEVQSVEELSQTRKAMKLLGLNLEDTFAELDGTPDRNIIWHVWAGYFVSINPSEPVLKKYLFLFFSDMYSRIPNGKCTFRTSQYRFKVSNTYSRITLTQMEGNTEAVGTYTCELTTDVDHTYEEYDNNSETMETRTVSVFYMAYRFQYSADNYMELRVYEYVQINHIYHDSTRTSLEAIFKAPDTRDISIPLSYDIIQLMDKDEIEEVYLLTVSMYVQVLQETELDWYETKDFGAILQVASLILLVIFPPAAITLTGIAQFIVVALIVNWAIKFLVEEIGGEAALALAAILTVVQIYYGGTPTFTSLPFASHLMTVVTALINATNTITQEAFSELADESAMFMEEAEDRLEEIQEVYDMLGESNLDPFTLINRTNIFNPNETPSQFFIRTTHTTNPGVLSLDAIGNYVPNALELPKANDIDLLNLVRNT